MGHSKESRSGREPVAAGNALLTTLLTALASVLWISGAGFCAEYYVDSGAAANGSGSSASPWNTLATMNGRTFQPGDTVYLKRGGVWAESLSSDSDGAAGLPITFGAYGTGDAPQIQGASIYGDHTVLENLLIDHEKDASDAVRVSGARNCTLRSLTVRNGTRDGMDLSDADGVLIDACLIHHFLNGGFTNQVDGHGIVASDTQGITIRGTDIHHVSGDSFQTDPDRDTDTPDDILIENCHFWTSPLTADFNDGWHAGDRPGENAIDMKMVTDNWDPLTRCRITIRSTLAHGWKRDSFIANKAAFNMKEKIEAVFDRVTVYDCEIAFRLRGTRGNANTTIQNAVVYDCEKAFRAEDAVANLKLYNSTFGDGLTTLFEVVSGSGESTWELRNDSFVGSKPAQAAHASNRAAAAADFANSAARDYHLAAGSALIDAGTAIASVTTDRDGSTRGSAIDVGAYEFGGTAPPQQPAPPAAPRNLKVEIIR